MGARGFSCAVSGSGQVLKSDLRPCLRRSAEDVSATRGFSSQARKNLWYPTNSLCTDAPLPSEKIGERESLSPTFFFWGGEGVCTKATQRIVGVRGKKRHDLQVTNTG